MPVSEKATYANTESAGLDSQNRPTGEAGPFSESTLSSAILPRALKRVFSFPSMLATLLFGGVFVAGRLFRVDPDLWWHIKVGETILKTHQWPTTDIYSFTVAGQPWLAYEWLGDIILATANRVAGLIGLELLLLIIGGSVVLALYSLATLRAGNSKAGFVAAALLSILAVLSFSLRPQMLGYLFLILTLIALERFRQGKRGSIWFLPPLMLLWVNTHGSWIVGLASIFVYWIKRPGGISPGGSGSKSVVAEGTHQLILRFSSLPAGPSGHTVRRTRRGFSF